jgi:O-antigen ligase
MFASPWVIAYWATLAAPAVLLVFRAVDRRDPWVLPGRLWTALVLAWSAVVVASALASPWRGPALLGSAPLLAGPALFLVVHDWLHRDPDRTGERTRVLLRSTGLFLVAVAIVSLGFWLGDITRSPDWRSVWQARNPNPLGHANYTAGLALLMLPCFAGLAFGAAGRARLGWWAAAALALVLLFGSGSRGGFVGLAALVLAATPAIARRLRIKLWLVAAMGLVACLVLVAANPRIRGLLAGTNDGPPNASDTQRSAMVAAGVDLARERPVLGWGPGSTPLAYPRVRGRLEGGPENVLQLHSLPVAILAELGVAGVLVVLGGLGLALRHAWGGRGGDDLSALPRNAVLLALGGYAVFSLTDWQLDVPVFAAVAGVAAALLAPAVPIGSLRTTRPVWALAPVTIAGIIAVLGRLDPTPTMNVEGLVFASHPASAERGITLLRDSLALNPDQEIAHFNLGWMLVVSDPPQAEKHFLAAARLVPDKGGVWFGLGLARLNQGNQAGAARALAIEGLNDPVFLFSPWWRTGALAQLRQAQANEFIRVADAAASRLDRRLGGGWVVREAYYVALLTRWALDRGQVAGMERLPGERGAYFQRDPQGAELDTAGIRAYRRERTGYPVLMRQPHLPPPSDLFDVQENAAATGPLRFLFPEKGWLPSPLLLELLDQNL